VILYAPCADCVDQGGRQVQESVRLSFTNEVVNWSVRLVEGTFAAYAERALCLAHARQQLQAAVTRLLEGFGSDADWELDA
jgi:hypothetical protein